MDGFLADSQPLLFEAERIPLAELGAELTEEIKKPFIGMGGLGYIAFLAGPPLLGLLADHVGYRTALLAIPCR